MKKKYEMSITLIDDQDNKLQIYKVDNSEESDRIAREKMLEEQRVIEEKRREEAAKLEEKKPVIEEKNKAEQLRESAIRVAEAAERAPTNAERILKLKVANNLYKEADEEEKYKHVKKIVVLTATFTFNDVDCSVPNDKIISFFERQLSDKLKAAVKINSVQSL
jgi:hypothetical protein